MEDESDIVRSLRSGEAFAFEELYRLYRDRIWRFLVRLAGNGPLAEDLFQETWLAAARHAHLLREDTSLARWLYTIAHNKFRNARRFGVMDVRRSSALRLRAETTAYSPCDAFDARIDIERVGAAIALLPEGFREVLALCALGELDSTDAAAVLEITPEAVRKRLSRARAELAALLNERPRDKGETR